MITEAIVQEYIVDRNLPRLVRRILLRGFLIGYVAGIAALSAGIGIWILILR